MEWFAVVWEIVTIVMSIIIRLRSKLIWPREMASVKTNIPMSDDICRCLHGYWLVKLLSIYLIIIDLIICHCKN